jgi:hypothetical protein
LSAANSISIATNSTQRLLIDSTGQIEAVSLGTAAAPAYSWTGDPNTGIYSPGADQVAISTGGTGRLFVDASGRVGIGTTTPNRTLHLAASSGTILSIERTGANTSAIWLAALDGYSAIYSRTADASSTAADLAFINGSTERARIDSSGRLLVGTSSGNGLFNGGTQNPQFQIEGTTGNTSLASLTANRNDAAGPTFYLAHSRGTAAGGTTVVQSGDQLGILAFAGTDGTDYITGATIAANVDGTPGTNDMPGRLVFSTTADGAASPTERMRIDSSGRVGIGTAAPSSLLHVNQPGVTPGEYGVRVSQQSATGNALKLTIDSANALSGLMQESTIPLVFGVNNIERARIDTSGRLLVGTSASFDVNAVVQSLGTSAYRFEGFRFGSDNAVMTLGSANGTQASPSVLTAPNFGLGFIQFRSYDGAAYRDGAWISAVAESEWALSDCPTRLTFSTTAGGASSPTERLRITNDGVKAYDQTAPAAVNATATLTVANLKTGIITSTSAAATDMTLPTGTDTEAGFSGVYTNMTFEWSVINTGPSLVRVLAGTAHTIVGSGSVATGTSGRFASRRTAANTFVTYRLS